MKIEGSVVFVTGAKLRAQRTRVIGIHTGTDIAVYIRERTVEPVRLGNEQVLADARAEETWRASRADPAALAARMQQTWDAGPTWKT